ncbi:MAG: hypothetical protein JWO05_2647 [Gemmatimonadetes bacterium]|nr:hypothetical protein [Gemmatimonadota bacterium]
MMFRHAALLPVTIAIVGCAAAGTGPSDPRDDVIRRVRQAYGDSVRGVSSTPVTRAPVNMPRCPWEVPPEGNGGYFMAIEELAVEGENAAVLASIYCSSTARIRSSTYWRRERFVLKKRGTRWVVTQRILDQER